MGTGAYIAKKKNKLPAAVMNDRYIVGFIIYFSAMSIDMVFKGAFWKSKKRMEFLIECWQEVGIPMNNIHNFLRVMGDPIKEGVWDKDGQYSDGKTAAALVLTSAYGVLNREELQNEIIVLAKKNIQKRMQTSAETNSDVFENSALSAAICEVTIQSHMRKYYSDLWVITSFRMKLEAVSSKSEVVKFTKSSDVFDHVIDRAKTSLGC